MRSLVFFALLSVAAAKPKPGGLLGGWDASALSIGHSAPALTLDHGPLIEAAPVIHAAPVIQAVHAAPVIQAAPAIVHAPVAVAKAATSYSSFQRVIHPVQHQVVAQPVVHAAPVVHAQPILQAAPVYSHAPISSYGHGW